MVIGNGLVAKRFEKYVADNTVLIFASGVSNSKTTAADAYEREWNLLVDSINNNAEKTLIYFSTCSIYDPSENNSPYVLHKLRLEEYIQSNCPSYILLRVSNLVGKSNNPNTVLNFLANAIKNNISFNLWLGATRNLIDIDDFYLIADYIISNRLYNNIVNIANPVNYAVKDIVAQIGAFYNTKPICNIVDKGTDFSIDTTDITTIIEKLHIDFGNNYLSSLLQKYYS